MSCSHSCSPETCKQVYSHNYTFRRLWLACSATGCLSSSLKPVRQICCVNPTFFKKKKKIVSMSIIAFAQVKDVWNESLLLWSEFIWKFQQSGSIFLLYWFRHIVHWRYNFGFYFSLKYIVFFENKTTVLYINNYCGGLGFHFLFSCHSLESSFCTERK